MNRVLCSTPGWTEPLCLRFFRPWHTGLPVRSGSEAGSGCVSRSADAVQSSFSSRPLGPVQYSNTSGSPPAPARPHPRGINRQGGGRHERKR